MSTTTDSAPFVDHRASLGRHSLIAVVVTIGLFGGLFAWAALTEIAGAVVAAGSVVVEDGAKRVQHQEGGIVSAILVRNGDAVAQGELLLRLDSTAIEASLGVVNAQLDDGFATRARLIAEATETTMSQPAGSGWAPGPEFQELFAAQQRLRTSRAAAIAGQQSRLDEQVVQLQQKIAGLSAQQTALGSELTVLQQEWLGLEDLLADGLTEASRTNTNKRQRASLEGEIARIDADIAEARSAISERGVQRAQVLDEFRAQVLQELQQLGVSIAELLQQKIAAEDKLRRLELRAPQSGIVHESIVATVGGVVAPGETVMQVVPPNAQLLVDARVTPMDVDKVAKGQAVRVRLSGLDARRAPELSGAVRSVSPNTSTDQATGMTYYVVRVFVDAAEAERLPDGVQLVPGMPAEVFVETDQRTVLEYLTKPLVEQIMHTFRED